MLADVEPAEATGLDGTRVVELPAEIDHDSAGQVQAALTSALAAGVTVLVADMTATTYCTLEGVRALLRAYRAAQSAGAQFRLAAAHARRGAHPGDHRHQQAAGHGPRPGRGTGRPGRPGTGITCADTPYVP